MLTRLVLNSWSLVIHLPRPPNICPAMLRILRLTPDSVNKSTWWWISNTCCQLAACLGTRLEFAIPMLKNLIYYLSTGRLDVKRRMWRRQTFIKRLMKYGGSDIGRGSVGYIKYIRRSHRESWRKWKEHLFQKKNQFEKVQREIA